MTYIKIFPVILGLILLTTTSSSAQDIQVDSLGYESFEMVDGDTTYVMKKYFVVLLKAGPDRTHGAEEAAIIQAGHMAHMDSLAQLGKIDLAGPMGESGPLRGIVIYNVPNIEEVKALVAMDPAVIANRLIMDIHPWWAAKGSMLK